MQPRDAYMAFIDYLADRGIDRETQPGQAILAMLSFYRDQRIDGCDLARDEDMLLFEWGVYDWGDGEHLEVGIARQVILPDEEDDDAIWQLRVTYRRAAEEADERLGKGNRWCADLDDFAAFEAFVSSSAAFAEVDPDRADAEVDLRFECAG